MSRNKLWIKSGIAVFFTTTLTFAAPTIAQVSVSNNVGNNNTNITSNGGGNITVNTRTNVGGDVITNTSNVINNVQNNISEETNMRNDIYGDVMDMVNNTFCEINGGITACGSGGDFNFEVKN